MENKVEIGDLLVFPGQVYQVQEIRESIHHPNDPCFVITEFPESDKSVEMFMTLLEARNWNFMVYKPFEL